LANTELHQFLKLPVLIHHFLEHKEESPSSTFAGFIYSHYQDHFDHPDQGDNDHENLPFKSKDCSAMHSNIVFNSSQNLNFCEISLCSLESAKIYKEDKYASSVLSKIWQPPQIS
jgi:hypothetical protein